MAEAAATPNRDSLQGLAADLRAFARARDWEQYHTPKNLAMALAGEAGELLACFQWLTPAESGHVMYDPGQAAEVESELADVLSYLIRLADVLGVDLATVVHSKIQVNEKRFPLGTSGPDESLQDYSSWVRRALSAGSCLMRAQADLREFDGDA